jgi:ABC-type lipoprotein release transport system permease subunit
VSLLVRLAWRNVWRNPRRTLLTALAGVFAVVLSLFSLAVAAGSHERWIENAVRLYPGHVQVNAAGYRDHRTLDYGMTLAPEVARALEALPGLDGFAPRLETYALALPDRDDATGRAAWLIGVDAERERRLSKLGDALREGRLPASGAAEVVVGARLAANLGVRLGDELVLLSSDYYGSQAAERFALVGVLEVGDPRMDDAVALVSLAALQRFVEYPAGLTHVALFARNGDETDALAAQARALFDGGHEVIAWPELLPDVVQFMLLDDVSNTLALAILILVVAFGLLNTLLMSVFERVREFGVLRALGVRQPAILGLVLVESLLISALGIAAGLALGLPLVLWLGQHPIELTGEAMRASSEAFGIEPVIQFKLLTRDLVWLPALLFAVGVLAALPPALRASRGRPVDALREV